MSAMHLQGFVARYVRDLLANDQRREDMLVELQSGNPFCEKEEMTVAIIDISGYSALLSILEEHLGKMSSEIITQAVGSYLGKIADVIFQHQGDIVKFLGDAVLVTFSATYPTESQDSISIRALNCCTEILQKLPSHTVNLDSWSQILKSACMTDESGYTSGDYVQRKLDDRFSLSGERIDGTEPGKLQNLLKEATLSLHIGVSRDCVIRTVIGIPFFRLDYLIYCESLGRVDLSEESLRVLKCFINKSILWRLNELAPADPKTRNAGFSRTGTLAIELPVSKMPIQKPIKGTFVRNEYRTVSVLFVKVEGEFMPKKAQRHLVRFLKTLENFSGVFQQYSVDDKGQSMLACFGLPPFADDKCGLLAAKAAAEFALSSESNESLQLSIAITTGEILFGTVGTNERRDAALLGDMVNVAARLLFINRPGKIIIDERTKAIVSGKSQSLHIWGIDPFSLSPHVKSKATPIWVSYKSERELLERGIDIAYFSIRGFLQYLLHLSTISKPNLRKSNTSILTSRTTAQTSSLDVEISQAERSAIESLLAECNENPSYAGLIQEILSGKAEEMSAKRTSDKRVEAVEKKSLIQSLIVEIIELLMARFRVALLIDDAQQRIALSGILCRKDFESMGKILSKAVEKLLMTQFDRLHPDFQTLLRHASILGQYFTFAELTLLLKDETFSSQDIRALISEQDKFEFLRGFQTEAKGDMIEADRMAFRHISIMNAIYDSIAYSEREKLHLQVAGFYDDVAKTCPGRRIQMLPVACYHYWRTRSACKILEKNSELGIELAKGGLYAEASKVLLNVRHYIEENRLDLEVSLPPNEQYVLEPLFYCNVLAHLATSLANLRDFDSAKNAAIRCLDVAGCKWPTTVSSLKKAAMRLLAKSVKYWIESRGGIRDLKVSRNSSTEMQPEWYPVIKTTLYSLLLASGYGALEKEQSVLVILWNLSHSIIKAGSEPSYLFKMLVFSGFVVGQQGSTVALVLAKKIVGKCEGLRPRCDASIAASFHLYTSFFFIFYAKINESLRLMREFEEYCREKRARSEYLKSFVPAGTYAIYKGDLYSTRRRFTDALMEEIKGLDISWLIGIVGTAQMECFITEDIANFEKYHAVETEFASRVPNTMMARIGNNPQLNILMRLILSGESTSLIFTACQSTLESLLRMRDASNFHVTLMTCLVSCVASSVLTTGSKLERHKVKALVCATSEIRRRLKPQAKLTVVGKISTTLCSTTIFYLQGIRRRAVPLIRRLMSRRMVKDKIGAGGELCLIGATCCALIALSSFEENEVRVNRSRAISMFSEMRAPLLVRWAAGQLQFGTNSSSS
ncbi:hypothetical protein HDU67_002622 [Dinochytrium kinnereticum]|nr:hypothetical protein HDU67_002622 [Dinochytrium kinnereticum]